MNNSNATLDKSASSSSVSSSLGATDFLLLSTAGFVAATATIVGRWVLAETGEVIVLLFSSSNDAMQCPGQGEGDNVKIDINDKYSTEDFSHQCIEKDGEREDCIGKIIGKTLLSITSSVYLRSTTIVLVFLSSAAFVIGIVLSRRELRRCWVRMQEWIECGRGLSRQFMAVLVSDANEAKPGGFILERSEKALECVDGVVLDDVLSKMIKMGAEFSMGAVGGILLYSVPDEIFSFSSVDTRNARRQLIHNVDPALEQILFRPGGAWDVLPHNVADFLMKWGLVRRKNRNAPGDSLELTTTTFDSDDSLDSTTISNLENEAEVSTAEDVVENVRRQSKDTILRGERVHDLIESTAERAILDEFDNRKLQNQQYTKIEEKSTPPELELQKILHRTSIAATILFTFHLCRSPSTRRSWGSAVNLVSSLGLATTAISAGVLSAWMNTRNIKAIDPVLEMCYLKLLEKSGVSRVKRNFELMFKNIRGEIKKNKHLQMALAFFVLYFMRRMPRKVPSSNNRRRIGR
jgi:hypothetical protein